MRKETSQNVEYLQARVDQLQALYEEACAHIERLRNRLDLIADVYKWNGSLPDVVNIAHRALGEEGER